MLEALPRKSLINVRHNIGCFKKRFTVVFQMLLCGDCYEKSLHLKVYELFIAQAGEYHCKALFETLHYQWNSHRTVTIPAKTRCVLLH
jgi:hypothetical protein